MKKKTKLAGIQHMLALCVVIVIASGIYVLALDGEDIGIHDYVYGEYLPRRDKPIQSHATAMHHIHLLEARQLYGNHAFWYRIHDN